MRIARPLRTITIAGSIVLAIALIAIAVSVLIQPLAVLILLAVVLAAYVGWRVGSRHVPRGTILELDLDTGVVEKAPTDPIDRALNGGSLVLRDIVDALDRASSDSRVAGLVVRVGNGHLGIATAQEIRDAVVRFRHSGKRAIAYSESFGEGGNAIVDYYLATSFDEIHLLPSGSVGIQGVLASTPFLRRLFDKIGATPDLDHREEYKAAKYRLTESGFVEPHREATTAILEDHFEQIVEGIASGRRLQPDEVRGLVDRAPLMAAEAREAGLVDHLSFRDQAYRAATGEREEQLLYADRYLKRAGRPHKKGQRIALVYGTGGITRGKSRFDPLTRGSSMGSDDVAAALRAAVDDGRVKAIVFRVDSPGGSAVASDLIGREIVRAREAGKPVVVSMGNLAGSGGYWVAAPADKIVAQPGTITGSIGVVSGKIALADAWSKIGVDIDELHIGRNATTWAPLRPFTDSERERNSAILDSIYQDFLEHVAEGRSMTVDEIRPIAKGRVWTGARAQGMGLVDELGGLDVALQQARSLAGMKPGQSVQLRVYPQPRTLPLPRREESSEPVSAAIQAMYGLFDELGIKGRGFELIMPPPWI